MKLTVVKTLATPRVETTAVEVAPVVVVGVVETVAAEVVPVVVAAIVRPAAAPETVVAAVAEIVAAPVRLPGEFRDRSQSQVNQLQISAATQAMIREILTHPPKRDHLPGLPSPIIDLSFASNCKAMTCRGSSSALTT